MHGNDKRKPKRTREEILHRVITAILCCFVNVSLCNQAMDILD